MTTLEELAINKHPKRTRKPCDKSCFFDGVTHRAGFVPVLSLLDGGVAGDVVQEICLECGKVFKERRFIIKAQPNRIK